MQMYFLMVHIFRLPHSPNFHIKDLQVNISYIYLLNNSFESNLCRSRYLEGRVEITETCLTRNYFRACPRPDNFCCNWQVWSNTTSLLNILYQARKINDHLYVCLNVSILFIRFCDSILELYLRCDIFVFHLLLLT